jgi:predicted permease
MQMLRFALRSLTRTPVVTIVVILSLGIGVGSNTAIFSLMHQFILRSLPVQDPDELFLVTSPGEFKGGRQSTNDAGGMEHVFSYLAFRELEQHAEGVADLAGFRMLGANIASETSNLSGSLLIVSGNYFPALELRPLLGRLISPQDDVHGQGNPVVVLGYGYWMNRLGGDPQILNKALRVNGHTFTVIGVTPKGFTGLTLGDDPDIYLPLAFKSQMTPGWDGTDRYNDYWVYLFGRPEPGVSREQVEATLNGPYSGFLEEQVATVTGRDDEYLERFRQSRLSLVEGDKGNSGTRDGARVPLMILMAATILVLLIAMANAANLLLARSVQRLGIRIALGASRTHLMSQLMSEALFLALAGGLAGLLLAGWTLSLLINWIGSGEAAIYFLTTRLQWPVLLFGLGVSVVAGILLGLYPAWEAARQDPTDSLKDASLRSSASRGSARLRKALVGAQVTISVLLLVPTGLFLKSLANLMDVDLGMRTEDVISFRVSPDLNGYEQEDVRSLYKRMEEQLAVIPGVTSVTSSMVPLISGSNWGSSLTVEEFGGGPDVDSHSNLNLVGPEFFSKMGIALLSGREFTPADDLGRPKVALVNQTFVQHFFGEENPLGKRFAQGWGDVELDTEIIGLVQDTNYSSVRQDPPRLFFVPWYQDDFVSSMSFLVRSALPAEQIMPELRTAMASMDPDLPLEDLQTMEAQVLDSIRADRIVLQLSAIFAIIATLLAMLGLYGVMAHSVNQRVPEIGIRMALGADRGKIRMMVMRDLMRILAIGLAVGIPISLGLAKLSESQMFGVTAFDAGVLFGAVAALTAAALAAGYIPARRATLVDPVESLRYE